MSTTEAMEALPPQTQLQSNDIFFNIQFTILNYHYVSCKARNVLNKQR
jgi:hypothetical protein